jgi:hypothetical protein
MYMCVHLCMYVCVCICVCAYVYVRSCVCACVSTNHQPRTEHVIHANYLQHFEDLHCQLPVCVCVCVCVCACVCVCVCVPSGGDHQGREPLHTPHTTPVQSLQ